MLYKRNFRRGIKQEHLGDNRRKKDGISLDEIPSLTERRKEKLFQIRR